MKIEDLTAVGISEEAALKVMEIFKSETEDYIKKSENYQNEKKSLTDEIERLNKVNDENLKNHLEEINSLKIDNAIENALLKSKAKTGKAVRALLDMDKIGFDSENNIVGINEQIKELTKNKDTAYLFESSVPVIPGTKIGFGDDEKIDTDNMNYEELCAYLERHPQEI